MLNTQGHLVITSQTLVQEVGQRLDLGAKSSPYDWATYQELIDACFASYIDNHRKLSEPIRRIIRNLVERSSLLDLLLYLTTKRYRDHHEHQLKVGALGMLLLDIRMPQRDKTLADTILNLKGWDLEDLDCAWWTAALLHDHAFPVSYLATAVPAMVELSKRYRSSTDKAPGEPILSKVNEVFEEYYPLLSAELRECLSGLWRGGNRERFSRKLAEAEELELSRMGVDGRTRDVLTADRYDHGVLGATNLFGHLCHDDQICEEVLRTGLLCDSARAIALHSNHRAGPIRLDREPLAYLLVLSDEIQEFDRVLMLADGPCVELDQIRIGPLREDSDGALGFNRALRVHFPYADTGELQQKTEWSADRFSDSKRLSLGRLKGPMNIYMDTDISTLLAPWERS